MAAKMRSLGQRSSSHDTGNAFDNCMTLTFQRCMSNDCHALYTLTKFDVHSSSRFLLERGHTHAQLETQPITLFHTSTTAGVAYWRYEGKVRKCIAVCATSTAPLRELTCHMGSHRSHPADVTFPPLLQPIKAGTRFSDPRGMQGLVDLAGLVTYQGGIPARRRSPIPERWKTAPNEV